MKRKILIFILIFITGNIFSKSLGDLYSLLLYQDDRYWLAKESVDILYSEKKETIKDYYPDIESTSYYDDAEDKIVYWDEMECFKTFRIFQKLYREEDVVSISDGSYTDLLSFYFSFIEYQDGFIYLSTTKTFNCKQNVNRNSFSQWPIKEDECEMILRFDGDYLYVYLNDINNLYGIFCRVDDKAINEYNKLIRTGKCDLYKVKWPRHADGSCDYDGSKKTAAVQTAKATPSTNVSPNKSMLVSENLKLRSGEATSTQVLTVMQAGTRVKILELGKAENIDGINSNWVKVEVQSGAKDRDGRAIRAGTVGWCYGGYLK